MRTERSNDVKWHYNVGNKNEKILIEHAEYI